MSGCSIEKMVDPSTEKLIREINGSFEKFLDATRKPEEEYLMELFSKIEKFSKIFAFDDDIGSILTKMTRARIDWLGEDKAGERIVVTDKKSGDSIEIHFNVSRNKWEVMLVSYARMHNRCKNKMASCDVKKLVVSICNEMELIQEFSRKIRKGSMDQYTSPMAYGMIAHWIF